LFFCPKAIYMGLKDLFQKKTTLKWHELLFLALTFEFAFLALMTSVPQFYSDAMIFPWYLYFILAIVFGILGLRKLHFE